MFCIPTRVSKYQISLKNITENEPMIKCGQGKEGQLQEVSKQKQGLFFVVVVNKQNQAIEIPRLLRWLQVK